MEKRQLRTYQRRFGGRMYIFFFSSPRTRPQTDPAQDNNYVRFDPFHVAASRWEDRYSQIREVFPVAMLNGHVGVVEYFAKNMLTTGRLSFGTI